MTEQEKRVKMQNKVKAIMVLCEQLQINISAEQQVTQDGLIKNVVFFNDLEKYPSQEKKEEPIDTAKEPITQEKNENQTPSDIQ